MTVSEKKHHIKTREVMRVLRRLDGFMHDSESIKNSLDSAFETGAISVFALDCIIAEPHAADSAIGKVPVAHSEAIINLSPLHYQSESIKYVVSSLCEAGIHVGFWCFLGDDDFKYSVSPDYQIGNANVQEIIGQQIGLIKSDLSETLKSLSCTVSCVGWLSQEQKHPDFLPLRQEIKHTIQSRVDQKNLPPKIFKRWQKMVDWRKDLMNSSGLPLTTVTEELICNQATEELTSFSFQGFAAPEVIQKESGESSLIFAGTYPDLGIQNLDDECLHVANLLGLQCAKYGTIHLPGAPRTAKILKDIEISKIKDFAVFRCGYPEGSPTEKKYGRKIRPSI